LAERRTVFVTLSPLLSDIISESVGARLGLSLVGHIQDRDRLDETLSALAPDIVFVGLRAGESDDIGLSVLRVVPAARMLAISSDGRNAYLHEMRPIRIKLANFSAISLANAIIGSGLDRRPSSSRREDLNH